MLAGLSRAQPLLPRTSRPLSFQNSARFHDLIRAGSLYLSVRDALALAIENNLDVELQRFQPPSADSDLLRAKGGGLARGLDYTLAEVPTGVGGPLSPVLLNPAVSTGVSGGSSVSTNALELGVLAAPQVSLSMEGTIPPSTGTIVPIYDPSVVGQLSWTHSSTPEPSIFTAGTPVLVTNTSLANVGIQQGFATGAQVAVNYDNTHESLNSLNASYNPFTVSSLGLTVTQPLLRNFGLSLNRRFIRIAGDERRIGSLLFQQQLIATVYGVIRLYTDFVALYADVKVKQESLRSAEKLLEDVKAQVEEGTLAPVEATRANAQVFSTRQDLANSQGLLEEQEAILKNVLTRTGNADPEVQTARIIPTDVLSIPEKEEVQPIQDLMTEAMMRRPDLGQARLQVDIGRIGLEGSKSATKPELDLVGTLQNNGLAGPLTPLQPSAARPLSGGYGDVLDQIFARRYPTYGIGLQLNLPIRNRIAEADLARDEIQVKRSEIRTRELENEARLEIEDALIATRRARASAEAATQARILQEQSLDVEQAKFEVGASTSFFVIQYESLLAQARSTEVAAMSAYVKARAALQRSIGTILEENGVSVETALRGQAH
ncbi:MAG: TolC family protein [Acidobacteriia bacterium]|nr:TolC family protein [Terriglobia bacterium]MBV8907192.1 TolC family protein [Terriglobia bacterium]